MNSAQTEPALVSCNMATRQPRRRFLSQALKYFSRQTYSPKELIVVDDPGEPAFDAIADVPGIQYLQTDARLTLGSKLNLGIGAARGAIIQKLDDDDYYHPEFLSTTVRALLRENRRDSIVAFTSSLVLIAATGELKLRTKSMFAGGTFCFFKELWQKGPFRDVSLAEDRLFLADHNPVRIGIDNPELYCFVRHASGHSWSKVGRSKEKKHDQLAADQDVTESLRKLPAYSKSLKEYMPEEDFAFYESQLESDPNTSQPG
jgi:glycosyltransferase involved in cell wall biosynthesis